MTTAHAHVLLDIECVLFVSVHGRLSSFVSHVSFKLIALSFYTWLFSSYIMVQSDRSLSSGGVE